MSIAPKKTTWAETSLQAASQTHILIVDLQQRQKQFSATKKYLVNKMSNIELKASDRTTFTLIEIILPNEVCEPADLKGLELPDGLDTTKGIVLSGRAPVWLFANLVHQSHIFQWVGTFDPRLNGAVVVESHGGELRAGDIVPVPKQ